jgi:hypothetical protein
MEETKQKCQEFYKGGHQHHYMLEEQMPQVSNGNKYLSYPELEFCETHSQLIVMLQKP